jgi:hypothetical protein
MMAAMIPNARATGESIAAMPAEKAIPWLAEVASEPRDHRANVLGRRRFEEVCARPRSRRRCLRRDRR